MFATLTKESVRMMAETVGHCNLPDDAAGALAEDVSYRLREVVIKSAGYMKNAKRRRMFPDDFNHALRDSDVQPISGCGALAEAVVFRQTREGDVHFLEDADITLNNLVYSSYVPKHLGHTSVKAHWMAVEGMHRMSGAAQQTLHSKAAVKTDLPELMQFYSEITKSLVGSNTTTVKLALMELSTNYCVPALLPYFINFVANGVKAVSHDVTKLTLLMRTVDSLIHNPAVFMEPHLGVLVKAVEYCILEPLAASINPLNDHWILRDYAARLLSQIVKQWNSPVNHLHNNTISTLSDTLHDLTRPFCSHYGATMGLISLGYKEIKEVLLPYLPDYWPHLLASIEDVSRTNALTRADAQKVYGAILLAAQLVVRNMMKQLEDTSLMWKESEVGCAQHPTVSTTVDACRLNMARIYQHFHDCFGDRLSVTLPILSSLSCISFEHSIGDKNVGLIGHENGPSGETMLADLMQQVREEETERQEQQCLLAALQHQQKQYDSTLKLGGIMAQGSEDPSMSDTSDQDVSLPTQVRSPDPSDESEEEEEHAKNFSEQLAVSSTISDPSKGTLKLKIISKRQPQGQRSPQPHVSQSRLTWQINKSRTETARHRDRHKRKHRQANRGTPESIPSGHAEESLEPEEFYYSCPPIASLPQSLLCLPASGEPGSSSGSESNEPQNQGKITLKLKVPSKEVASE